MSSRCKSISKQSTDTSCASLRKVRLSQASSARFARASWRSWGPTHLSLSSGSLIFREALAANSWPRFLPWLALTRYESRANSTACPVPGALVRCCSRTGVVVCVLTLFHPRLLGVHLCDAPKGLVVDFFGLTDASLCLIATRSLCSEKNQAWFT